MSNASFSSNIVAVVQNRGTEFSLEGLTLGLLTVCPSPEGIRGVELVAEGYARQAIEFEPRSDRAHVRNCGHLVFGPMADGSPQPMFAAIYDRDGAVVGYGRLFRSAGNSNPNCFEFSVQAITFQIN